MDTLGIPGLRDPTDFAAVRQDIYDAVLDGVRTKYPLENATHRLELVDTEYDGPEIVPYKAQKQAILKRKFLYRPLKGTWRLVDKATGDVLDQKRTTIAKVPMLTQRGTYTINGSDTSVAHQMRLRPGVYVRRKANGDPEAHFNIMKGGPSFRLLLEPKTGVFRISLGQGSVPVYPVLKASGVSDDAIREILGDKLWQANAAKQVSDAHINKFWARLAGTRAAKEVGDMSTGRDFRAAFEHMEVDPEVTGFTLGSPITRVSPELLLKAAAKLVKVNRGEADTDDRDALAYQETYGPADLFRERIIKDSGRVGARMLWRASLRKNLSSVPSGALTPQLLSVIYGSGLGTSLEEINPLDALDQAYRVTRMGEGGLSSAASIPDDARAVQPSQFLYVDPVRTPESLNIGVDLRLARNTRKGIDRALYTRLSDAHTGDDVWLPPQVLARATVAPPGARQHAEAEGHKRVAAIRGGRLVYVTPDKIDFEAKSQMDMYNPLSNLLPALNSMKGGRILMASKWFAQAMPMREREAPLVQVDSGDGVSAEQKMGSRVGAVRAKASGRVVAITPDDITVQHLDGTTTTHDLYNNFIFNRKSFITNTPRVAVGDVVAPGQLLATSNYTDDNGGLAMGRNLRVGYMSHKDSVYEDAILVSESGASKLATERLYTETVDTDDLTNAGTSKFVSLFPSVFTRAQLDKLDDGGVVKPGAVLEKGDPIMLAVRQRTPKGAGMLYRGNKTRWADVSRVWEHDFPGEVTDAWQDNDGMRVAIKAYAPAIGGDKLVLRHGSKGVISRVIPDDQMPVAPDGRPLEVILNPQGLITRCYDDCTEFLTKRGWVLGREVEPSDILVAFSPETQSLCDSRQLSRMHVEDYKGKMLRYQDDGLDFCVTPSHRMWVRTPGGCWAEYLASALPGVACGLPVAAAGLLPPSGVARMDYRVVTETKAAADDLQCLFLQHGYSSTVRKSRDTGWEVTRSPVRTRFARDGWSRVDYVGKIYCPHVSTGYVVTRRNGHVLIAGNSNPSQVIEALLGKAAEKRGTPYVLSQDYDGDRLQYAIDELKKAGIPETDDLYDPLTGRTIKGVTTGVSYFMALHHQADSKESARGTGGYTIEGVPTAGEDGENPKRIGAGELGALVAHGVPAVIREVKTVRGQSNDDYWNAVAMGYPPPAPTAPQIYTRFLDSLKAAGINVRDSNGRLSLAAMTDKDVEQLAAGEITVPETVKWMANFERGAYGEASPEPVPGGLFDRGITGGHGGNRFGFIRLAEPLPNPVFEPQIKHMLGMTTPRFEAVLYGREDIQGIGTGPEAMLEALRRIKPEQELESLKGQYKMASSASARDTLLKRMRALDGIIAQGLRPADLMITKVPVLPPVFRPININSKFTSVASPNVLYMDLMNATKNFKDTRGQLAGEAVSDAREAVYGSLRAVSGMGDPVKPSRKKQNVKGILDEVFGAGGPKTSLVQRSLIGGTTDMSGRGVITPDPNLDMDHIGIPENLAWPMFGRFVVRKLARQAGDNPESRMRAVKLVADRDPRAKQALLEVMEERPVLASRAPVLHKFGIMGFEPVLVPGKTIRLSPSTTSTFGADFDGDCMNVHAVVTPEAVREVRERMLPSKNIRSPANFGPLYTPRHEFLYGLYAATTKRNSGKLPTVFRRVSDALAAYRRGELDIDDEVHIVDPPK